MAELFGLTRSAAKLVGEMAARHRQRLPDAGRRTRRVSVGGAASTGGIIAVRQVTVRKYDSDGVPQWANQRIRNDGSAGLTTTDCSVQDGQLWCIANSASLTIGRLRVDTGLIDQPYISFSGSPATVAWEKIATDATHFYVNASGVVQKRTHDGAVVWSTAVAGTTNSKALHVDAAGNVYASRDTGAGGFMQLNSGGTVVLNINDTGVALDVAVNDATGDIYTVSSAVTNTLRKYDSSGVAGWTASHGAGAYAVAVDQASGNIAIAGDAGTGGYTVRVYNSSGSLQWSTKIGLLSGTAPSAYALVFDSVGNLIVTGAFGGLYSLTNGRSYAVNTYKLNASGTLLWLLEHGGDCQGVDVDADDNIYLVGAVSDNAQAHAIAI